MKTAMDLPSAFIDALTEALGDKGVIADQADMASYLAEERGLYQGEAGLVARPASTEEVAKVMALAFEHGIPVVPQGGNTGLCGGGVAHGGLILSLGRMNNIRETDPVNQTMTVDAGCILASIQDAADDAGFLFPLSLGAEGTCQIGGNLATNAGGTAVLRYGNARDLVLGLEVVTPDGRVWNGLKGLRKDNTGYCLKHLFMGAEGTLGIITGAVLKLFPKPKTRLTCMAATDGVPNILALFSRAQESFGDVLTGFELLSGFGMALVDKHIDGVRDPFQDRYESYALIELTSPRADEGMQDALEEFLGTAFEEEIVLDAVIAASESQSNELWSIREGIPEAQKHEGGSIKHDISVPISKVGDFIAKASLAVEAEMGGLRVCAFGHIGDGNIHFNLTQPEGHDREAFMAEWPHFNRIVHDIVMDMGGSFSAEHGIGQLKTGEMNRYKSAVELDMMRAIKTALDPKGLMNPGKVIGQ